MAAGCVWTHIKGGSHRCYKPALIASRHRRTGTHLNIKTVSLSPGTMAPGCVWTHIKGGSHRCYKPALIASGHRRTGTRLNIKTVFLSHPQAWYHGGWLRVDTHQRKQPQVLQTSTDSLQTQENWDSSQYKDSLPQPYSGLVPWRLAACGHTSKEAATGATNQHW